MRNDSLSIRFFSRPDRKETTGEIPIYVRITANRQKAEIATRLFIEKETDWDPVTQRVKSARSPINLELTKIAGELIRVHDKLKHEGKEISSNGIKDLFLGRDQQSELLISYLENYFTNTVKDSPDFASNTIKSYKTAIKLETITTLNYALDPNEQLLLSWPLFKASTGTAYYPNTIQTDEPWYCEVISATSTQAILKSFSCILKYNTAGQNVYYEYPMNANAINSAVSLYTFKSDAVNIDKYDNVKSDFSVFPNPTSNSTTVSLFSSYEGVANAMLFDISGQPVFGQKDIHLKPGKNKFAINLGSLASGMYCLRVVTGQREFIAKLIIQ